MKSAYGDVFRRCTRVRAASLLRIRCIRSEMSQYSMLLDHYIRSEAGEDDCRVPAYAAQMACGRYDCHFAIGYGHGASPISQESVSRL